MHLDRVVRPGGFLASCFPALLLSLALASSAQAVAGNANVTIEDPTGGASVGSTVLLLPIAPSPERREQRAQTDSKGVATLSAEEGEYDVVVVSNGRRRRVGSISIEAGKSTPASFTFNPVAGSAASLPGGVTAGLAYVGQFYDWKLGPETETVIVNGVPLPPVSGSSAGNDFSSNINGGGVQLAKGLPNFQLGPTYVTPSINLSGGGASGSLDTINPIDSNFDFSLDGTGPFAGTGASFLLGQPSSPWFALLDYQFLWMKLDMQREPCSAPLSAGTLLSCSSDSEVEYKTHSLGLQVGYSWSHVAVHGGLGYGHASVDNQTRISRQIDTGSVQNVVNVIDQELERRKPEGIFGIDALFGPFFARAETRFTSRDASLFLTMNVGLPAIDLWSRL